MTREELESLNLRGGAFFDRVSLWLREESGEELAEILGVERGWGDWTGFYHVQIVTTENLYHNVDISLPWFCAGKRPYLGPFVGESVGYSILRELERRDIESRNNPRNLENALDGGTDTEPPGGV